MKAERCLVGACVLLAVASVSMVDPVAARAAPNETQGTVTKVVSCTANAGMGYSLEAKVEFSYTITGKHIAVGPTRYALSDRAGNKSNVDTEAGVWPVDYRDGKTEIYLGRLYSPDAMIGDGQWHALSQPHERDLPFEPKLLHFAALVTFDISGGADPSCWADTDIRL
jgi:hypothetical protein